MDIIYDEEAFIPPAIHGYTFTGMFDDDEDKKAVSLVNHVIESVLFEENGFFAGFRLKNVETAEYQIISPLN